MADDEARGRPPEYLTYARLMLDTVLREIVRGEAEPLVLENAREKVPCECVGDRCFRDGVIGSIESPADIDNLCSQAVQLEGARRVRVEVFLNASDGCARELAVAKAERALTPQDVEDWILCVVDRVAQEGPFFD